MRRFLNKSALTDKYGENLVDVCKEAVALKYLDVENSTRKLLQQLSLDLIFTRCQRVLCGYCQIFAGKVSLKK